LILTFLIDLFFAAKVGKVYKKHVDYLPLQVDYRGKYTKSPLYKKIFIIVHIQ